MRLPRKLKKQRKKNQKTAESLFLVANVIAKAAEIMQAYKASFLKFPSGGTVHKGEEMILNRK